MSDNISVMVWRGVRLTPRSMAGVAMCWSSADEVWKVTRFDEVGPFYARLRVGAYRVEAEGSNVVEALDAARTAAQTLRRQLNAAIPRRELVRGDRR